MVLNAQHVHQILHGLCRHLGSLVAHPIGAGRTGYVEPETTTDTGLATHTNFAVHQRGQLAAKHQPDAGAGNIRALPAEPLKRLEQLRLLLVGKTRPSVVDP